VSRIRGLLAPVLTLLFLVSAPMALGQDAAAIELLRTTPTAGGGQAYSLTLQALGLMTLLTLLPAIILSMTSYLACCARRSVPPRHRPTRSSSDLPCF